MMSSHALKEIRAKTAATPAPILFPLTANLIKDHHYEYIDTCYHNHDIYRVEKQRDVSRSSYVIGLCILHNAVRHRRIQRIYQYCNTSIATLSATELSLYLIIL